MAWCISQSSTVGDLILASTEVGLHGINLLRTSCSHFNMFDYRDHAHTGCLLSPGVELNAIIFVSTLSNNKFKEKVMHQLDRFA